MLPGVSKGVDIWVVSKMAVISRKKATDFCQSSPDSNLSYPSNNYPF